MGSIILPHLNNINTLGASNTIPDIHFKHTPPPPDSYTMKKQKESFIKKYDHSAKIELRKKPLIYVNRLDGSQVSLINVLKNEYEGEVYVKESFRYAKYSIDEFHETYMLDVDHDHFTTTKKYDDIITVSQVNHNGRVYNVLDPFEIEFDDDCLGYSKRDFDQVKSNANLFTYDLVMSPGYPMSTHKLQF